MQDALEDVVEGVPSQPLCRGRETTDLASLQSRPGFTGPG